MKKKTQRITIIALQAVLLLILFFPVHLVSQGIAGNGLLNVFGMVDWYVGTPFYIVAYMTTLVACILPLAVIFAAFRAEEENVYTIGMVCSGLYTVLNLAFYLLAKTQVSAMGGLTPAHYLLLAVGVITFFLCMVWRKASLFEEELSFQKQTT